MTGRCRSGARCLDCIERDGLIRPPVTKTVRLMVPTLRFSHRMVELAAREFEHNVEKMRRAIALATCPPGRRAELVDGWHAEMIERRTA